MKIRDLTLYAMFAALISVCAWINVPAPVPFTLQTFAVFLACLLLGGKGATVSTLVYIIIGAAGLPVFSGFNGGIGAILGATGGYIIGFLAITAAAAIAQKVKDNDRTKLIGLAAGLIFCYILGTAWFMAVYLKGGNGVTFGAVLMKCVVPFVVPDLAKMLIAYYVAKRVKGLRRKGK